MPFRPTAVADLGSNTLHLLIATVQDGRVRGILDESEMVRLGEDVDREGEISEGKIERAIGVVRRFKHRSECFGVATLHLMATQAVRAAGNREELLARIEDAVGLPVTVLSTEDEARLAFD